MSRKPVVCLAGTLDTKGTEYAFVRDALEAAGVDVLVVDCGVLGEPYFTPDIASAEVAARAGISLTDFSAGVEGGAGGRNTAITKMSEGLQAGLEELCAAGKGGAGAGPGGTRGTPPLHGGA